MGVSPLLEGALGRPNWERLPEKGRLCIVNGFIAQSIWMCGDKQHEKWFYRLDKGLPREKAQNGEH